jgi:hypothetical protein
MHASEGGISFKLADGLSGEREPMIRHLSLLYVSDRTQCLLGFNFAYSYSSTQGSNN